MLVYAVNLAVEQREDTSDSHPGRMCPEKLAEDIRGSLRRGLALSPDLDLASGQPRHLGTQVVLNDPSVTCQGKPLTHEALSQGDERMACAQNNEQWCLFREETVPPPSRRPKHTKHTNTNASL